MSVLVVGLSHRSAPLRVLERAALDAVGARAMAVALPLGEHVQEAVVLATCNRLEVYAEVSTFHGGLADVSAALAARTGIPLRELTSHLYVHYDDMAVAHLFTVAAGLDSMAVGETQVLGQVRVALRRGQEDGTVGRVLDPLLQQSLRVGKRAHSETDLDRVSRSLVEAGLSQAAGVLGLPLSQARTLVVGAGSMSALAATTLHRLGARDVVVANRTPERARRLADSVEGTWLPLADHGALVRALAVADVVLSCTGAVGHVLDAGTVRAARALRGAGRPAPQLVVDLALPRDVAPEVADLDGVALLGLDELGALLARGQVDADVSAAKAIVAAEVAGYLGTRRAAEVAPTVAALRSHAREVVAAELARLRQRVGPLDERTAAEVEQTVHRVVEKLLHTPTVRVKSLAADASGADYAAALRALFDLELDLGPAVTAATVGEVLAVAPAPDPLRAEAVRAPRERP